MVIMDRRKIVALQAFSRVKELVKKGEISEAKEEISRVNEILEEKEKNALMNTFVKSIMDYNESIEWNDICHS